MWSLTDILQLLGMIVMALYCVHAQRVFITTTRPESVGHSWNLLLKQTESGVSYVAILNKLDFII